MIYSYPMQDQPIRQGDIFIDLPRMDISLQRMLIVDEVEERVASWSDLDWNAAPIKIIVPVRSVAAIVVTQDCDAIRSPDITLCEIRTFAEVEKKCEKTSAPSKWKDIITQQARVNLKWFYLPPDPQMGFTQKMGVNFLVTLRIPREDLELLRSNRRGRLNDLADEHFRERLSDFFRRYPYDEWYPLNKEEFAAYSSSHPDCKPFPGQE